MNFFVEIEECFDCLNERDLSIRRLLFVSRITAVSRVLDEEGFCRGKYILGRILNYGELVYEKASRIKDG